MGHLIVVQRGVVGPMKAFSKVQVLNLGGVGVGKKAPD